MAADDVSGTLMEVLGRARIEQVDFLREALHKLVQAHGTGSHPESTQLCVVSRQMNARDTALARVNDNGIHATERTRSMFPGYVMPVLIPVLATWHIRS